MSIQIQDVPAPAKATAKSLKATFDRMGGANERERVDKFETLLESHVKDRTIDLGGVKLEEVAELSLGSKWRQRLVDGRGKQVALLEADAPGGQAISSDFFAAVTGQRVYSEIRQASELPEFYFTRRLPVVPSDHLGEETVPEIEGMGDVSEEMLEAQGYSFVGFGPHTTSMPASKKRGLGVQITEETLKVTAPVGLTASVVGQANRIGRFLGYKGEIERIDVVSGYVNPYARDGVATDTYLTAGAYVNKQTSAALSDYTDIDSAEQLLSEILDPDTGLPMLDLMGTRDLIVMPAQVMTALAIVGATEIRKGDITTGTGLQTVSGNPLSRLAINVVSSKIFYQRVLATLESEVAKAKAGWFYGSLDAFAWKEFWPLSVAQQGPNSDAAFTHDVVARWKARYHGAAFVRNPRLITRNEDGAWA
jgi:hypothetical protein